MLLYRCSRTLINIIFHIIIILSWCKLEAHHNAIRLVRTKSLNALLLFRTHVWTQRARGFRLKIVLTHSCFSLKKILFFFCTSFSSIVLLFLCVCISVSVCLLSSSHLSMSWMLFYLRGHVNCSVVVGYKWLALCICSSSLCVCLVCLRGTHFNWESRLLIFFETLLLQLGNYFASKFGKPKIAYCIVLLMYSLND